MKTHGSIGLTISYVLHGDSRPTDDWYNPYDPHVGNQLDLQSTSKLTFSMIMKRIFAGML